MRLVVVRDHAHWAEYNQLRDCLLEQRIRIVEKDLDLGSTVARAIFVWEDDFDKARRLVQRNEGRARLESDHHIASDSVSVGLWLHIHKSLRNIRQKLTIITISVVMLILAWVYWLAWMFLAT